MAQVAGHGSAAQALRLGPLLGLLFVGVWALAMRRGGHPNPRGTAGAVALAVAGTVHLALIGQHTAESAAAGVVFAAAGVLELVVAVWLWRDPAARRTAVLAVAVTGGLVAVYAAARLWSLPLAGGREPVDSLGLVTKALEVTGALLAVAAATGWRLPQPIPADVVVGGTAVALAVGARPIFGLGPTALQVAAAVLGALAGAALGGPRRRPRVAAVVTDGAVVALLLRAAGPVPYLLGGLVAGLLRPLARRWAPVRFAPAAWAALAVLALPPLNARMEILHVSHPGDATATLVVLVAATTLAAAAWWTGRLPAVVGFFAAHLAVQALRVAVGATSVEAVEIPAASLGLFVVASIVLADPELMPRGRPAVAIGVLAGLLDGALHAASMPYSPLIAIAVSIAVGAALPRPAPADHVEERSSVEPWEAT